MAASYHSLFATVPDNPRRRHIDLPSSCVYFVPDPEVWEGASMAPTMAPIVDEIGDALQQGRRLADGAGCAVSAWTVCLHDTSLGHRYPDIAVQTLWGDRVPVAPCLRHPQVRDYVRRLGTDLGNRADVVQLESACWTTLPHHRHAKIPARSPEVIARLTEVCFCQRCRQAAAGAGLDVSRLVEDLKSVWNSAHSVAVTFTAILAEVAELAQYLDVRSAAVTELVSECVAVSRVPVEVVTFGERSRTGMKLNALEAAGAAIWVLAYGPPAHVDELLNDEAQAADRPERLRVGLSLLPEHTDSAADLATSASTAVGRGAVAIGTYHLGLATAERRRWLSQIPAEVSRINQARCDR